MAEITRRLTGFSLPRPRTDWLTASLLWSAALWAGFVLSGALAYLSARLYLDAPINLRPIFDDSYISLTFARNLAEHGKLSFDGETWSTGATSPLHVAVLALLLKAGVEPLSASIAAGVAGHVLLAGSVYLLGWALFRSRLAALLGAAAIAFTGYAALDAGNGLETSLFMALVALVMATYALNRGPYGRAFTGFLLGLAVLTRPEGAFLLAAVVLYRWFDRSQGERLLHTLRDSVLLTLPAAAALAGLALYSLSVTDALGGTASAKLQFFQEDRQPFQDKMSTAMDNIGYFAAPLLPLLALALAAPRHKQFAMFGLFWAPVVVMYVLLFPGGLMHYFFRYQHPVLPLLAVMAGGGAAALVVAALRGNVLVKLLVVAGLTVAIVPIGYQYDHWKGIFAGASDESHATLESMAFELNEIIQPGEVLATHDIGAVGYYGHYRVLDLVGLVNPEAVKYHDKRELAKYVESVRPDYLLIFPDWDVWFLHIFAEYNPDKYELVKVFEGGYFRILPYYLYRVHLGPAPEPEAPALEATVPSTP